jgi:hypothetical protein
VLADSGWVEVPTTNVWLDDGGGSLAAKARDDKHHRPGSDMCRVQWRRMPRI